MRAFEESSIYCMNCNLQVIRGDFDKIQNFQEFSTWKNEYDAIYKLWLVSGSYETWASEQLTLPRSILNRNGRELTKIVGTILKCYYFIHQDNSRDQMSELKNCPDCGEEMKSLVERHFPEKICDRCDIVVWDQVEVEEEEDVEQSFQPDLFGRHDPCKARLAPPKTQVKTALEWLKK